MLGVPKNYSERQVKAAHRALMLQWHPDKGSLVTNKVFAAKVFTLVQTAYEGLMKALEDKALEGFVIVSEEEKSEEQEQELVTETAVVVVEEDSE